MAASPRAHRPVWTIVCLLSLILPISGLVDSFTPEQQQLISQAHGFELTYRASGSVADDSFYTLPNGTNLTSAAPGTLFKVEEVTNTSRYTLAPNLSLSRFIYQSQTSNGTLVPVSGYVLWPYIVRNHSVEGYPVVAWAHGTSGTFSNCAPSNIQNLWHHFQAPYTLALNGYVVVATDYAGLGISTDFTGRHIAHEWLTAPAQANDVLNSFTAARTAFPELSKKFVILGSSQGGAAVWSSAEKLAEAPMQGYLGAISLSPLVSLQSQPTTSPLFAAFLMMLVPGMSSRNSNFTATDLLSSQGLDCYNALEGVGGCNTVLFNLPVSNQSLNPSWQSSPALQQYEQLASVGGKPFAGPMLVMEGAIDNTVYPPSVVNAVADTARLYPNSSLEFYLLPDVSHAPAMYSGWQVYSEWIKDRFEGVPVSAGFKNSTITITPIRQQSAQQIEANWYLQNFTATWQLT